MPGEVSPSEFAALEAEARALKADVVRIEGTVSSLAKDVREGFESIGRRLDERGRPNYLVPIGAANLLMIILAYFAYNPLSSRIDANSQAIGRVDSAAQQAISLLASKAVTRDDLNMQFETAGKRRDEWQAASTERDKALAATIEKLRDGTVTWQAHDDLRRYFQAQADQNHNEISDLRTRVGDTFGLRDALQMIGKRLDSLEQGKGR